MSKIAFEKSPNVVDKSATDQIYSDLSVSSTVDNVVDNNDGTVTVSYTYTVQNQNATAVNNITVQNDLLTNFEGYNFDILSITSSNATVSPTFDGVNDLIVSSGDTLQPGGTSTINIQLKLYNNGDSGPFNNSITASGTITPVTDSSNSGSNSSGDYDDDDIVANPDDYQAETDLTPRHFSLTLTNQISGNFLDQITNGSTISRDHIDSDGGLHLGIGIDIPTMGSIRIIVRRDGVERLTDIQNFESYELDWIDWLLDEGGDFTFGVQFFSQKNGGGILINEEVINFAIPKRVIQQNLVSGSGNATFTLTPSATSSSAPSASTQNGGNSAAAGSTTGYTTTSTSTSHPQGLSLPATGFSLANAYVFGICILFSVVTMWGISKFISSKRFS